jgi:phosphoribosyl 1,2-cyclic phosphodiesterase
MKRLGLSIQKVKAIFISHEHSDHISGVPVLAKKHNIPVYITPKTLLYLKVTPDEHEIIHFIAYQPVMIGELTITAFPKFHDAIEPHSFIISCRDVTVGVFTDIGAACQHLITHFSQCNAAFLEANYDDDMLDNGGYPYHLKRRIRGGRGHLSNKQALELFLAHKPACMSHLLLSHLSKNNNSVELVYKLFKANANGTEIVVASRYEETPVYRIGNTGIAIGRAKQLAFEL